MNSFGPLDSIISGYAYENATTALGVLEEGAQTKRWISTEMLCTLDNFIKVLLFSERVFYDGTADEKGGHAVLRDAEFGASDRAKELFDQDGIFQPISKFGNGDVVNKRVADILKPVTSTSDPLFVLSCTYSQKPLTIRQELLTLDIFLIEHLIELGGLQRFKPVFPGEHLYLGFRQQKIGSPVATHSIADLAGRRVRMVVQEKMETLNTLVSLGAPPIPTLPPIFVGRAMNDYSKGSFFSRMRRHVRKSSDIVPALLDVRRSPAMKRFRKWAERCVELIASTDIDKRTQAINAYNKLKAFSLDDDISVKDFSKGVLSIAGDTLKQDVLGIMGEVVTPVMKYISGYPIAGLRELGGKGGQSKQVEGFLQDSFGDKFNRSDMDYISTLLSLPDNSTEWKTEQAVFEASPGRIDHNAPILARPCFMTTQNPLLVENAEKDFEELWKKAVPFDKVLKDKGKS